MTNQFRIPIRLGIFLSLLFFTWAAAGYGNSNHPQAFKKKDYYNPHNNTYSNRFHHSNKKYKSNPHDKKKHKSGIEYAVPEYQDASVHDPSVIRVDDTFYVFGSHLAAAKTTDFLQWEMVAEGVNENNPLFENVVEELAETFAWSDAVALWANDVIQLEDGRFYMYHNLSRIDSPRASLGLAVADNIEGPYTNQGIFLQSGMWGEISEDGVNIYDPRIHPNTVDPDTFFDQEGRLWMIYGSYSGGIFILRMDNETGLPVPGQGYGKHLLGGNHSRIEGAYVLYSPDSGYYYMFVSFGGLDAVGGYNVRVARSLQPEGPYFDALGNNMADVKSDPALPLFDDASIEPFAQKLMGSHLFDRKIGEPGTGIGTGYVSPGHNSAYYDEETGKYFLIFHTRFPGLGEFHQIRVHEMFINEDGWPVVAPYRYAPLEISGESSFPLHKFCRHKGWCNDLEKVIRREAAGDYKLINHEKDISAQIKTSWFVSLDHNGGIGGEFTGHWYASGHNRITIDLDNIGLFKGVLSRQWNETAEEFVVTFTALSDEGVSIWGSRLEDKRIREVLNDIAADLSLGDTGGITNNLQLPAEATRLAAISWSSSDPEYLADDGTVTRPEAGEGNRTVTLTATIAYKGKTANKEFEVIIRERAPDGLLLHYAFENSLADATGQTSPGTVSGNFIDVPGGNIGYSPGIIGNAAVFDGASGIRMPNGLISGNTYTVSLWLSPTQLTAFTTTFFGARDMNNWVSVLPVGHGFVGGATMVWSGTLWYDAGTGMNINANEWSHIAFTVNNGELNVYINGELRFNGFGFPDLFINANGIFSLGVNWWDIPYNGLMDEVRVYEEALSAEQIVELSMPAP
jgi:arabinan endo-1,5-alpha-L-arabinosidase